MKTRIEIDAGTKTFSSGLLPELIAALRRCRPGDLLAVIGREADIGADLEAWCRFTRNTLIDTTIDDGPHALGDPMRRGARGRRRRPPCRLPPLALHEFRLQPALRLLLRALLAQGAAAGARPRARAADRQRGGRTRRRRNLRDRRRALSAAGHRRDPGCVRRRRADDGPHQRHAVRRAAARNAALIAARPLELADQPRQPDARAARPPSRTGTWARAWRGIERARAEGFRVRLAATVSTDAEAEEFRRFLDAQQIADEDRVIRRIALRGFATQGIALARADLVPEITITAEGVYWHPVGAEDADLLVTSRDFSARRVLRRGAPRLRPGKRASAPVGEDLQLRVTGRAKKPRGRDLISGVGRCRGRRLKNLVAPHASRKRIVAIEVRRHPAAEPFGIEHGTVARIVVAHPGQGFGELPLQLPGRDRAGR